MSYIFVVYPTRLNHTPLHNIPANWQYLNHFCIILKNWYKLSATAMLANSSKSHLLRQSRIKFMVWLAYSTPPHQQKKTRRQPKLPSCFNHCGLACNAQGWLYYTMTKIDGSISSPLPMLAKSIGSVSPVPSLS